MRLFTKTLQFAPNRRLLNRLSHEIINFRVIRGTCGTTEFVTEDKLMKRTRAAAKIQQQDTIKKNKNDEETTPKIQTVILNERQKLNFKSLQSIKNARDTRDPEVPESSKKSKSNQKKSNLEIHINEEEKLKPNTSTGKGKRRAVVDLEMMKKELTQLEDPPITPWEKELSSNRLQYDFFDIPCEELAQQLLGKVLVRYLENGTILKGRIVETEGYLGAIDKAAQSYQNKVTPRNLPMYMPPGTIYVYMTYGMYYCFNISSQERNAHVMIKAVEPLLGLEYMELLRNMRRKTNGREKEIAEHVTRLKQYELCNSPSKVCDAFAIDQEAFDQKLAYACNSLWLESESFVTSPTIVVVPSKDPMSDDNRTKTARYYVLGSASVGEKNSEYEKHAYVTTN